MKNAKWPIGLLILGTLILQAYLWGNFFVQRQRAPDGAASITVDAVVTIVGITSIIALCRIKGALLTAFFQLISTLLLVVINFSYLYWNYGSRANFNIDLSRLDAIYFALGTLSTAGTGNITAISETARGLQSLQMALDLGLVLFAVGLVLGRFSSASEQTLCSCSLKP